MTIERRQGAASETPVSAKRRETRFAAMAEWAEKAAGEPPDAKTATATGVRPVRAEKIAQRAANRDFRRAGENAAQGGLLQETLREAFPLGKATMDEDQRCESERIQSEGTPNKIR